MENGTITITELELFSGIAKRALEEWGFVRVAMVGHNAAEKPDFEHFKIWGVGEDQAPRYIIVNRWHGQLEEV